MLEVTIRAREKLQEALLEEKTRVTQVSYRITPIPAMPNRLGIALDKEKKGDQVVKSKAGLKVLLIQAELAQELEGMVLDYQDHQTVKALPLIKFLHIQLTGKRSGGIRIRSGESGV